MIARKYNRRIKVYKTITITDGFGGNIAADELIATLWADVYQNSAFRDNSIGLSDFKTSYTFKVRNNASLIPDSNNLKIEYRDQTYVVNDIQYSDNLFREITMVANG